MSCPQCCGIATFFSRKRVAKELKHYRAHGPDKTTRMLLEALRSEGVEGLTLLDVGGGFGPIPHSMLRAGMRTATNVDASSEYIAAANEEAERQGWADRVTHRTGNFVELAPDIPPADVVTLDRVICCYHDMETLVGLSSERAHKLLGLVYPRDTSLMKIGSRVVNFGLRLRHNPFRVFIHPSAAVDQLIRQAGFERRFYQKTLLMQVVVYGH